MRENFSRDDNALRHYQLWKIMAKLGCPANVIAMVRQFHDSLFARVQNDGEFSDPFPMKMELSTHVY